MYSYDYAERQINLFYDDDKTLLTIKLDYPIYHTEGAELFENNGILYYIFKDSDVIWWEYNNDFYSLSCGFDINECAEEVIKNIQ